MLTEANEELCAPFYVKEIRQAVFSMNRDKSLRRDGFNPGFYKKF